MGHRPGRRVGAGRHSGRGLALPLSIAIVAIALFGLAGVAWLTGAAEYGWWWLTNASPPQVALAAPTSVVRGTVGIDVRIPDEARARPVEVSVDGRPLPAGPSVPIDTTSLPDGQHQIVVVAEDSSWRRNRAEATAMLLTDNTPPRVALELEPPQVKQGHTWVLRIRADEPAAVEARLGDRPLTVEAADGFGWAVVGFSPSTEPSSPAVVVDARDRAGNTAQSRQQLDVARNELPIDRVQVPANLATLLASDIRTQEDRRLTPTYQQVSQPRLWDGPFLMPVTGEVVTEFGTERSYNGGPVVSYHQGSDIAAPAGQPVRAPARGRVVLIDRVELRGNVIVLDHGLGVFTTYGHLSSIDVQIGQTVERGQPIGKVGNTGLSTGPHLHWELWVRGANVDPIEWTKRSIP